MHVGVALHLGERSVLGLDVLEVVELVQVLLQMWCAQVPLEQGEPQHLGVVLTAERIEHADPHIAPFELLEAAVALVGRPWSR